MERPLRVRKGVWTEEEDDVLRKCVQKYGEGNWHQVPSRAGLNRCRKSCRLRWLNYLKPNIKRGEFQEDEVDLMLRLHKLLGNRWSLIAGRLPGRTANGVKNYWNTRLKKKEVNASPKYHWKHRNQNVVRVNVIKPRPRAFKKFSWTTGSEATRVSPNVLSSPKVPMTTDQSQSVLVENNISWWESLLLEKVATDEEQGGGGAATSERAGSESDEPAAGDLWSLEMAVDEYMCSDGWNHDLFGDLTVRYWDDPCSNTRGSDSHWEGYIQGVFSHARTPHSN